MEIRSIEYYWNDDEDKTLYAADVVIGDGKTVYDDKYPDFDERIFFYFHDMKEFLEARHGRPEGVEFTVTYG